MNWGIHFLFFLATMTATVVFTPRNEWLSNGLAGLFLTIVGVWCDRLPFEILTGRNTSPFAIFFCSMVFVLALALGEALVAERRGAPTFSNSASHGA
jgi:hypothetical protein